MISKFPYKRSARPSISSCCLLSAENRRERLPTSEEETVYLKYATPLLHDLAVIRLDWGLRPEKCFRLEWSSVRDGLIEIQYAKTNNAWQAHSDV